MAGFFERLKSGLSRTAEAVANLLARPMDAESAEQLRERLIAADFGPATADEVVEAARAAWKSEAALRKTSPAEAAAAYEAAWNQRSPAKAFDLCVLGLGDDSHIASLWPQCPLIGQKTGPRFTATEWPGRGWRLTITEAGLAQCGAIVVLVGGAGKAAALRAIAHGEFAPKLHPGQVLREHAAKVTWLADQEAAAGL